MTADEWRLSEGDERDTLRLEIQDRLRRLNGVETEDENGYVQSEPVEVSPVLKDIEAAKLNDHLASPDKAAKAVNTWKAKRVRCQENGHPVWHLRSECIKEPRDNRNGGPAWTWKWIGPQDKKKQEDAMWAEHEKTNKGN